MRLPAACLVILVFAACGGGPGPQSACSTNDECDAHEFCQLAGGSGRGVCECVAGYQAGDDGCAFGGLIGDPEFARSDVWQMTQGAAIDAAADPRPRGGVDLGQANFAATSLCGLATVGQTVTMPTLERSERLVVEVSYRNQFKMTGADRVAMGVSLAGGWFPLPNFSDADFHTQRLCLPEGGYAPAGLTGRGASVRVELGPYERPTRCPTSTIDNFAIDHFSIEPATPGECTSMEFGKPTNFDAEGRGGWVFDAGTTASHGDFVDGRGVGGSRAAAMTLVGRCDPAVIRTTVDVPAAANPLLTVFVGASPGSNARVRIGDFDRFGDAFTAPIPAGGNETLRLCLPPSLRGQTVNVEFSFDEARMGACSDVVNHELIADELQVSSNARECEPSSALADASFESMASVVFGSFATEGMSQAVVQDGAGAAHQGSRFLALQSFSRCSQTGYRLLPTVPPSTATAGPALTFFANVGTNVDAVTSVVVNGDTRVLAEGGGYQRYVVCLDPAYVDRPQSVLISHYGGDGACNNLNYLQQAALIDDIAVTNDPGCPR